MEEQKQTYIYLDKFINDSYIDIDKIIYQQVEINQCDSVDICIVQQHEGSIRISQGYSFSKEEPVPKSNINTVHFAKCELLDIIKNIK